jgi:type II secretory pathway component GspD/PulD (secretin)
MFYYGLKMLHFTRLIAILKLVTFITLSNPTLLFGQSQSPNNLVQLDISGEMELKSLVEYVAEQTGIRFTYGTEVLQKKVNIIATEPIPASSLLDVLQSVLQTEGLVIADAGVDGWKRIIPVARIPEVAKPSSDQSDLDEFGATEPLTRVFRLKNSVPTKLAELLRPTMSQSGASVVPVDDQGILIVTDIVENIRRVAQMIELLDSGKPRIDVRFVDVEHVKAEELSEKLAGLLEARAKALGQSEDDATGIEISVEQRTNQLILIGDAVGIAQAEELLKYLDTALPTVTQTFLMRHSSPEQLDSVLRQILKGRTVRPPYESRIEGSTLIIESSQEMIQLAEEIRIQIDTREAPAEQSPIRFYKIKNVPAEELLSTVQSIFTGEIQPRRRSLPERRRTSADAFLPGPNYPPLFGGGYIGPYTPIPQTPALRIPTVDPLANDVLPESIFPDSVADEGDRTSSTNLSSELIGDAQVTVDVHTNTLIVVAKPEVQRIYASLIEQLDERRPQVLVEAKIVIIDTSNDFTLGVEVSGGDRTGGRRAFAFTSYGFSEVDPVSGALEIVPGVGFNGALVDPSTADVVVRALTTHRRARVLSSPKILVNDNAEGELTSVLEIPFTSVNASNTVATTSFAGFAEAGTTITVTPTISDDNYMQMDYTITLNTFTGDGSDGVPPPRQTNEVRSRVTVPDGYTVIVGGLTNKNTVHNYRGIPYLEKIPIVRHLTGTTSNSWDQTSLFVFLRPIILRDDKFKDLMYVSDQELKDACLPGEFPASQSLSIP